MSDGPPVETCSVTLGMSQILHDLEMASSEAGMVSMSAVAIALYPLIPLVLDMELELARRGNVDRAAGPGQEPRG